VKIFLATGKSKDARAAVAASAASVDVAAKDYPMPKKINLSPFLVLIFLGVFSLDGVAQGQPKLQTTSATKSADSALVVGFPGKGDVSRVYADGRMERIEIPATRLKGGSVAYGTDDPRPSPNNKYIAYVRDNDLWIMDVDLRDARKITAIAMEQTKIAGVSITGWSWDSRRLLFYLQPAVDSSQVVKSMLSADAGNFRIVDLDSGRVEQITLPGRFAAWLPDGSFLLIPVSNMAWQPLWRWRTEQKSHEVFVAEKADYIQFHVSRDGRAVLAKASFPDKSSDIVRIDLATGGFTRLTTGGDFTQYQWPAFSPSGLRLAYVQRKHFSGGISAGDLVVDGVAVARYTDWPQFTWIDDNHIVLRDNCQLSVVDIQQRRPIAQQKIPVRNVASRERYCRALEAF
jgi:hypothetical protein